MPSDTAFGVFMKKLFNHLSQLTVNRRDALGRTALYKAAKHGNLKEVKRQLAKGADPNIANDRGVTALHQAAYWGEVEIVKTLIKAGADVKADNGSGWTPLHSASLAAGLEGRKKSIQLLIEAGADAEAADDYGWTPKDYVGLWLDNGNELGQVMNYVQKRQFADEKQQPNMKKLGLDKEKACNDAKRNARFTEWYGRGPNLNPHRNR